MVEEESTTDSTTYDIGNGKKLTEFYSQDVRFENEEGELVDYDASLTKVKEDTSEMGASLESYAYENKAGDKKQYFPEQLTEETPILMEYGAYQIRLRPATEEAAAASEAPATETEEVAVEKETVTDIYEEEQTVPTKAVYTFGKEQFTYQYTSTDIGVKEEIVLEKEPESNVFRSILEIPGLTIRKNALDEGFTIYDGDEMVAGIEAPSMNDASGEAYSEDLTCEIQTLDKEEVPVQSTTETEETNEDDEEEEASVIQVAHVYTLKTGDGCLYRFNAGGQLVAMLEPNGTFLLYQYDEKGRLLTVQTEKKKKLVFSYPDDSDLLTTIELPDETILSYTYTDGQLTKAAHNSSDAEDAESVSNSYGYGDEGLERITDRKKNTYEITYEGEKAVGVSYPQDSENYEISYKDQETSVSKKTPGGAVLYTTSAKYDAETGKTLQETDADGNVTSYTYGYAENPYLVTRTARTVGYEELKNGTVSFATVEKISETTYNEEEQVTEELEEDGTLTKYTYGEEGEWTEELPTEVVSTRKGETISRSTTSYDAQGNVEEEQDVTDRTNEMLTKNSYDAAGNLTESVTKEAGLQTSAQTTEYDKLGNIVEEKETSGEVVSIATNTYDAMGRVLTTTDASTGEVTAYTYDYLGREVKTETTLNGKTQTTSATYDANGTVATETDADGVKTKYVYDSMNRVSYRTVTKGKSAGYKLLYTYEDVTIWDGRSTLTIPNAYAEKEVYQDGTILSEKYYDGSGRLVKEKAGGIYTDYVYDQSGNQVVSCKNGTDADTKDGCVNLTLYDEEGREYATIQNAAVSGKNYAIGTASVVTQKTYDNKGNVAEEMDANGVVTSYTYDDSSRVTEVLQDAKGRKVSTKASYETDIEKETTTTSITDAKGHVSEEIQDAAGLTTATKDLGDNDEESIGTSYAYDSKGNKVKEIYESGAYKTFEYDDRNLLTATKTFTAEDVQTLQSEYTYDDKYRLIKTVDSKAEDTGVDAYRYSYTGYDAYGRTAWTAEVNSKEEPTETQIEEHKIHYTYDVEDKVTAISYAMATEENVQGLQFVYDSNRWLSEVQAVVGVEGEARTLRTYKYDSYGRLSKIQEYPDFATKGATCITKQYLYNDLDQVVEMTYQNGSKVLEAYAYAYDKNGNVIQETEVNNTPETEAYQVDETKDYTYDALGRLVKTVVTDHLDAEKQVTTTYEYDEVGNRQKKTIGSTEIQYTYNGLDQLLTAETTCGGAGAGTVTYTYDENGNQVKEIQSKTQTTIVNTYDEENRLSKVTTESPAEDGSTKTFTQENLYNGEGQRIQKKEGAAVTDYYYQDGVVSYTTDGSDTEKVIQNLLGLEGNIISAEKQLETEENGYNYYLYNKDIQGSTTSIIDETGKGELSYEYDEFGETTIHGGSGLANEICYTGGIYDESTGLYYLNARYYDPTTGRFLTEDTYRGESGDVSDWHLYAYCANDPINYVDPSGHWVETALDVLSIGWSAAEFATAPSWITFGALLWDVGAAFLPFVPGSYSVKAYKMTKNGKKFLRFH